MKSEEGLNTKNIVINPHWLQIVVSISEKIYLVLNYEYVTESISSSWALSLSPFFLLTHHLLL